MRAEALRLWTDRTLGSEIEVRVHHALEASHGLYRLGVGLYNLIQRRLPRLHHLYFNYLELAAMHGKASRILGRDKFTSLVADYSPHRVISMHAHTNHGFFDLARRALPRNRVPRCVTYCGELSGGYGFSRHWVNHRADGFVGATEEICAASRAVGMPARKILRGGFLLRPHFYSAVPRGEAEAARLAAEMGLEPDRFTVLLSTGLAGANNHLDILKPLAASGRSMQVVALCGRNRNARLAVEAFARSRTDNPLVIRALPHTERMLALKRLANVLVARPGTGATSEAIQLGLPLIHNGIGGIMPQEAITVKYCRIHHCAYLGETPDAIVRHILRLHDSPCVVKKLRDNLDRARPTGRPEQVVRWIRDLS